MIGPKKTKTARQLERHFKGVANHWRIEALLLIANQKGMTVEGITKEVGGNFKTVAEHVRRLAQAGLVEKRYRGHAVEHSLSPYGKTFVSFIKTFSNS
ncbi:MAG TPA: winged helix-turn-helix domain-containing protein [Candidatus Paceibacterota bacterium]|nr:winged helix-turn-helix domain-containing protein [Candidatus Paceibacterota bacterium]